MLRMRKRGESFARKSLSRIEGASSRKTCLFEIDQLCTILMSLLRKLGGGTLPQHSDEQVQCLWNSLLNRL